MGKAFGSDKFLILMYGDDAGVYEDVGRRFHE